MVFYVYDSVLAYNPASTTVAKSAVFAAYDITDTSNSTPLEVQSLSGLPTTVRSNSDGMLTIFGVEDRKQVKIVSGSHEQVLTSMTGIIADVEAAESSAASAASASQTAAGAAADSAALAQTRGLPSGGLPGQVPVKASIDDYDAAWDDVALLVGDQPLRFWGAASTLPPGGSGQQVGDIIFKIGGSA